MKFVLTVFHETHPVVSVVAYLLNQAEHPLDEPGPFTDICKSCCT